MFRVNTKSVLGLLRVKQIGLEHGEKKPKEAWAVARRGLPPPLRYEHAHRFNVFFCTLPLSNPRITKYLIKHLGDVTNNIIFGFSAWLLQPWYPMYRYSPGTVKSAVRGGMISNQLLWWTGAGWAGTASPMAMSECVCVCVYPFSRGGGINPFWGSQGFYFFKQSWNQSGGLVRTPTFRLRENQL